MRFEYTPIPSPAVPKHHRPYTTVPDLVGLEVGRALTRLMAIWPCVHVEAATATAAARLIVIAQRPHAGTRLPAFGVVVGRGYRPTTVNITVGARP
jgi:beta-lactam-binding protein with PASTA domain